MSAGDRKQIGVLPKFWIRVWKLPARPALHPVESLMLRQALQNLPAEQYDTFLLYYVQGLTVREVATVVEHLQEPSVPTFRPHANVCVRHSAQQSQTRCSR